MPNTKKRGHFKTNIIFTLLIIPLDTTYLGKEY